MQVTTSQSGEKGARTITLDMPCGNTVAECVKQDSEEIVHNYYGGQKKVAFQAGVRRLLKEDKTDKEINAKMAEWKPGLKKPGKSAVEKATDAWAKLSHEEQKKLLIDMRK